MIDWTRQETPATRTAAQARDEARAYLAATDWLVVRRAETQKPIPADILAARAKARALLDA